MAKDVKIQIVGDASKYKAALGDASNATSKFSGETKKAGANFTKFGAGGLAVAGVLGAGMLKAGESASNLGESINAVNVTFGKSAAGILKLGEDASTAVGLSNVAFNGLAVQFSSFATTIAGKGGDVVQTMADMTGRAADFASVMNIEVADAAAIFQSGLAGETEPLKKFGIDLSAAAVEAYAAANGIGEVGKQLSESEKVTARYDLLMQSTAKTQGDFANTSDGAANSMRIAKAEMENASASLGQSLTPIMAFAATTVGSLATGFADLNEKTDGWLGKGAGIAVVALGAASGISLVVGQVSKMVSAFDKVKGLFVNAEGELTRLGTAAKNAGPLLVVAGVAALGLSLHAKAGAERVKKMSEAIEDLSRVTDAELQDTFWNAIGNGVFAGKDAVKVLAEMAKGNLDGTIRLREHLAAQIAAGDATAATKFQVKTLTTAIDGEIAARKEQKETTEAAAGATEILTTAEEQAAAILKVVTAAVEAKTEAERIHGILLDDAIALSDTYKEAQGEAAQAVEDANDALRDHAELLKAEAEALNAAADANRAAADANYAVIDATEAYDDHLDGLADALKEAGDDQDAINKIYRDGTDLAAGVADAVNKLADEQAAAQGVTRTATEKLDQWNLSMLDSATKAGPAQRAEILRYIAQVNNIPEEQITQVEALIAEGKLEEAQILLAELSKAREAKVEVDAKTAAAEDEIERLRLEALAKPIVMTGNIAKWEITNQPTEISLRGRVRLMDEGRAGGGRVRVGEDVTLVGEKGPELVSLPAGSMVHTASETTGILGGGGGSTEVAGGTSGGGVVIQNLVINMPVGSDGDAIISKIQQWERRNGPGWRS